MDISQVECSGCGQAMKIQRLRCNECNVNVEGDFEASALARLTVEEQAFATAFLRSHGSIKKMEALFGISYPTVKNRLNAIVTELDRTLEMPSPNSQILERLSRGEITVDQAMDELS